MVSSNTHELRLIFWETTVACNLECIHCRRLEVSRWMSSLDLSTEQALDFISSLAEDFDPKPVLVFSGGEPLVRKDLFELMAHARLKGVPTALATNGTLIDQALAEKIAASGVKRVSISLDGASSDTHDRFRKMPGSFEKAAAGFRYLRTAGVPVQLNATLTRHNIHELEAIYRLSLELGAAGLHYFLLVPVGCGQQIKKEYQLTPEEYEEALLRIYDLASEGKIYIRPICAPHYFRILAQKGSYHSGGHPGGHPGSIKRGEFDNLTKGCLAGTGICFISHKGEVFPCGYLPLSCGNVRFKRLKDIWDHSDLFYVLRRPLELMGKCGICAFKAICSGCRARAHEAEGNFLAEEPNCLYEPRKGIKTPIGLKDQNE